MGKYPRARVTPFSSVVGSNVTLHDPDTERVVGQLAILNTAAALATPDEWKASQIAVAEDVARRINAYDDLLEALQAARSTFAVEHIDGSRASISYDSEALRPLIVMLDSAIAKALGKA